MDKFKPEELAFCNRCYCMVHYVNKKCCKCGTKDITIFDKVEGSE